MKSVLIYTSASCPFCVRAQGLLDSKNVQYHKISVDGRPDLRQEMMTKAGQRTVPQIWIGDRHVGGCDDLFALDANGQLDKMISP